MLIEKVDIKEPFIQNLNPNISLSKSNSALDIFSSQKILNKRSNLPYLSSDKKIKYNSIQSSILNSFDMRNIEQNTNFTNNLYLKYKPRRSIISKQNRANSQNTLIDLRRMPLNENKVFNSDITDNDNKVINMLKISEKKSNELSEEDIMKCENYSFRYKSLLRIEKNIKMFDSIKKLNNDLIASNRLGIFDDIVYKLFKLMNEQKIIFEQYLMKLDFDSENEKTNKTNNNNNYIPKKDFDNLIKKEILFSCNYNNLMNKLIFLLFEEISSGKEKNYKLLQRNHEEDLIINSKNKSLNELSNYLNRYDIDSKINYIKRQEQKNKLIKESFTVKQNEYIKKIYKLEKELKIMADLLNKNKIYFNKCKEYEEKIDTNKKETEKMKVLFKRELREKNSLYEEVVIRKEELSEQLSNMKNYVDNLNKDKKNNKSMDIMSKAKIKKLQNMLNERSENIRMLNEELEYYLRQNYFLKKTIKEKEFSIVTLEMRIKKDKEREREKENINDNNNDNDNDNNN